jgi:hypothetical protein
VWRNVRIAKDDNLLHLLLDNPMGDVNIHLDYSHGHPNAQ